MESIVKLGEVQLEITGEVKTTEDLKVLLRWGWGAETTNKMAFKPSEDLKIGDGIKVTVEKVVIVPDPVEEKVEEATAETEPGQEPVAESESTGEAAGETEPVAACSCEGVEGNEKAAIETFAEAKADESATAVDDNKTV